MKRMLKNSIYFAIIVGIISMSWLTYDGGNAFNDTASGDIWGDFPATIPAQWRMGTTPQQDINNIGDLMNVRYAKNATVAGTWSINPVSGTDYVRYEVHISYNSPKGLSDISASKDLENRIIGELAIATAKLRSMQTNIPGVDDIILNEMIIYVFEASVPRRDLEEDPNRYAESEPKIDPEMIKNVYHFDRDAVLRLSQEDNPLNWRIYERNQKFDTRIVNQ
jgi:hypothetical protein